MYATVAPRVVRVDMTAAWQLHALPDLSAPAKPHHISLGLHTWSEPSEGSR